MKGYTNFMVSNYSYNYGKDGKFVVLNEVSEYVNEYLILFYDQLTTHFSIFG